MQVSFVVPLYNCLSLTQAMVASLQATLPRELSHEIILVDDGSTDGTRDWLATLAAPFRVVLNERNFGYAGANNRGAEVARGDFLALLNNDLILTARWLEPMLQAHTSLGSRAGLIGNVQREVRTGAVDHAGIFINHKGKPEHDRVPPSLFSRLLRPVREVQALTGACLLVERSLWNQLGGFDEGYINGCEDVDLCLKARALDRVNGVALRSVVRHHVSASPGRKLRDEHNTFRLTQRWRDELERLGAPHWTRHFLETWRPKPDICPDPVTLRQAWLHSVGLRRRLPDLAPFAIHEAIEIEISRWRSLGL